MADTGNLRIRKVSATTGIITTIAGTGVKSAGCLLLNLAECFSGDGGPATSAQLYSPVGLATDSANNVYLVDGWKIRKIDARTGFISTVAGSDKFGYTGDGGLATSATLYKPNAVAVDGKGNIYIPDWIAAAVVRRVDANTGIITTIAGTGPGGNPSEGALATSTQLGGPTGVTTDPQNGVVYVFDASLARVFALSPLSMSLSVVNAAGYASGGVAPGEIVTLFGTAAGPPTPVTLNLNSAGLVDTVLQSMRILFDGIAAPMIYAAPNQASAIVPYAVAGKGSTQVQVEYQGKVVSAVTLSVVGSAPGIFTLNATGQGQAAAVNEDGSLNQTANPARKGSSITIFATGEGSTTPPGVDGKPSTPPYPKPTLPVIVGINNAGAEVLYAGSAPGLVAGVLQVNVRIPLNAPSGNSVIVLRVGDAFSQPGVTIAVQ